MRIEKPIFILGIQRSGTTILYNLFTRHKNTAFFEGFSNRYYLSPWKFNLIPFQIHRYKTRPNATEGRVWRRYFTAIDYVNESHATKEIKKYYYSAIKSELRAFRAERFVNKNPAFCVKLKWLNAMFPNAYYILIWRDSKAVIYSIYKKMLDNWEKELNIEYEHGFKGFVTIKDVFGKYVSKLESCINFYNYNKSILLKELPIIKDRTIEIHYEQFILNPRDQLKKLYNFTELNWYNDLEREIPKVLNSNNNTKWKKLEPSERTLLENAYTV